MKIIYLNFFLYQKRDQLVSKLRRKFNKVNFYFQKKATTFEKEKPKQPVQPEAPKVCL